MLPARFGSERGPRQRMLAATAAICLAACTSMAARSAADYERGSTAEAQFRKDAAACEKQAEASAKEFGYGPYDPTHGAYNRMFDMCMRTSGYSFKPQP